MLQFALRQADAIQFGEFTLTSGKKSNVYIEKFRIFECGTSMNIFAQALGHEIEVDGIQAIVGMVTGGMLVAAELSREIHVSKRIYLEGKGDDMHIARQKKIDPGLRVLIVDDILTTGGTLARAARVMEAAGAVVVGYGVLIDRSEEPHGLSPLFSALRLDVKQLAEMKPE